MDDPVAEIPGIIQTLCTAPPETQQNAIEAYFTPTASFTHPFCRTGSGPWSRWLISQIYRWYKILSPHVDVSVDSAAFDKERLLLYVSIHQDFRLWLVPFYNAPVALVTVLQLVKGSQIPDPETALVNTEKPPAGDHHNGSSSPGTTDAVERAETTPNKGRKKVLFTSPPDDSKKPNAIPTYNSFSVLASPSPSPNLKPKSRLSVGHEQYYIQSQNDLYQTSEWIKFLVPWGIGSLLMVVWQFLATLMCVVGTLAYDLIDTPRRAYIGIFGTEGESIQDTE